jgi:small subunit ribosomal protein S16
MAVKLRLRRMGTRNQPKYRIVVADSRTPRDGVYIENLGHYNPLTDPATVVVDADRARYWVEHGAQPTESVRRLFRSQGITGI